MGKHYDINLKKEIVNKYFNGNGTLNSLQKEYGISYKTIFNWLKKEKLYHSQENDINHSRGRKKEENIDYKERYEILKKYQAFLKAQREKK
jgi:transposase-like protein